MADQELAKRDEHSAAVGSPGVSPEDEPSAEWGWHGGFPRGSVIMGWISAVIILLMLIGNHQGRVEDIYLVVVGVGMILLLIRHTAKARHNWRS